MTGVWRVCQEVMEASPTSGPLLAPQPPGPSIVYYPLLSAWVHPFKLHLGLSWRVSGFCYARGLLAPCGLPRRNPALNLLAQVPDTEISERFLRVSALGCET